MDDLTQREQDLAAREAKLTERESQVINEDGTTATDTAPARPEDVWAHDTIDLFGETWQVIAPTQQAMTALTLSSGKYVPQQLQNNFVSLFLRNHMSEQSFTRLFERFLDPQDDEFDPAALGTLMRALADLTISRMKDD
ncbi:hypothetical protein [Tomitella gaofuii]|uniref:hypothetical protein n=1 Tax=Tomitella gaofuii TaxID=2760083 RepID=UPI0015FB3A8D|nr:hypothetical protein [Tomitella gaofuii]